jgi:hypothetical protein
MTDYSFALDLLPPPGSERESSAAGAPAAADSEAPRVLLLETPTDMMQQAWQHLRSSPGFRPELYLSWEQAGDEPFPQVRVHDTTALLETDPRMSAQTAATDGTLLSSEMEITRFYRIDGTARLRRSRFLNLDLDIEFREPVDAGTPLIPAPPASGADAGGSQDSAVYRVHAVKQSRQVQILELNYFDGPVLGVLALVTRVDPVPPEAPPADLQAD